MKLVEDRISKDSIIIDNDIIKVGTFLNHQIDVELMDQIGQDIAKNFSNIDKVVTIESSGIAVAYAAAYSLGKIPLVFAKKAKSKLTVGEQYQVDIKSFTKGIDYPVTIDKNLLSKGNRVLIVDDFLAAGNASLGLYNLCNQAGAEVVGVAVAIEKGFQGGRDKLEALGIKVYSAANIKKFENNKAIF